MRQALRIALILVVLLTSISGLSQAEKVSKATVEELSDHNPPGTTFNGQDVPPIKVLDGSTYEDTIDTGYWLVEAYSPYCGHCQSLAPKLQTLYEYYYTSDPTPTSPPSAEASPPVTFTTHYNLHFAKLDCIAFGTACSAIKSNSFPTLILFKNGAEVKRLGGDRDMQTVAAFIEECLDLIKPDSRPKYKTGSIPLPAPQAKEYYPPGTASKPKQPLAGANTSPSQVKLQKPADPNRVSNPKGTSIPFEAETFQRQITRTLDPWLIKFYAPWCPHCQRMAASWSTMAREMQGKLDIGEVNCDVQKRLCKDMDVTSYPTIIYFRGPERLEYEGMRGLGDLIQFGHQAVESNQGVPRVDALAFDKIAEKEEVIFVYFYDHATTSEDIQALDRLPITLIGRARIVKSNDEELASRFSIFTYPRLIVWRDGKILAFQDSFEKLPPERIRDVNGVRGWMQSVWHPLVPELTAQNARGIMNKGLVVLGILNRSNHNNDFEVARKEMKTAAREWMDRQEQQFVLERQELRDAKMLRIEEAEDRKDERGLRAAKQITINMNLIERKEVAFAWVDGAFWERWVRETFGITVRDDGERVIINDHDHRQYWDKTSTGNPIVPSRTSILETLTQIYGPSPKLPAKPIGSSIARAVHRVKRVLRVHPWLCAAVGVFSAIIAALVVRRTGGAAGPGGAANGGMGGGMGMGMGRGLFGGWGMGRGRKGSFGSGGFFRLEGEKEAAVNGKAD